MLDKKQEQRQIQQIVSESHGIVDQVHCPYYTDERSEFCKNNRDMGPEAQSIKNKELYFKSQYIARIIYQGKVKNISCHLLNKDDNKCTSPLNENKTCHLI